MILVGGLSWAACTLSLSFRVLFAAHEPLKLECPQTWPKQWHHLQDQSTSSVTRRSEAGGKRHIWNESFSFFGLSCRNRTRHGFVLFFYRCWVSAFILYLHFYLIFMQILPHLTETVSRGSAWCLHTDMVTGCKRACRLSCEQKVESSAAPSRWSGCRKHYMKPRVKLWPPSLAILSLCVRVKLCAHPRRSNTNVFAKIFFSCFFLVWKIIF